MMQEPSQTCPFNLMAFQIGSPAPGTFANSNEGNTDDGEYDGGVITEGRYVGGDNTIGHIGSGCGTEDSEYDPTDTQPCF